MRDIRGVAQVISWLIAFLAAPIGAWMLLQAMGFDYMVIGGALVLWSVLGPVWVGYDLTAWTARMIEKLK